jgi:PRC-barrel domain
MDHTLHVPLDAAEINEANLMGATIYDPNDEEIGTVAHVHGIGPATKVVVDVGGFLGIGAKPVALDANQLNFMRDEDGVVHATTSWTKDQVADLPEHHH